MKSHISDRSAASACLADKRLIYFSSVPYSSYAQRPHFMVSAFADIGFESVLWIDPYPTRLPILRDLKKGSIASYNSAYVDTNAYIEVFRPAAFPIEPIPLSHLINHMLCWGTVRMRLRAFAAMADYCVIGIGRPSLLGEWALQNLPHQYSFIDVLDNFMAFYRGLSRLSMARRLKNTCRLVKDVFCSSRYLTSEVKNLRRDALTVLNGCVTDRLPEPCAIAKRKCIGYVGTIGQWFDWPLVVEIARALSNVTIRLIGPEFVRRPRDLPENVEFLGERPHREIFALVGEFAVGLIPFRISELTEGVDPIKYYEYRSMTIPVWSTKFGEMRFRGQCEGVAYISHGMDWEQLWAQAKGTQIKTEDICKFRAEVAWSRRLEPILTRALMGSLRC